LLSSVVNNVHGVVKGALYSGVYSETWDTLGDGGPTCYNELSVDFRIIVALIMAPAQYFLQKYLVGKVKKRYNNKIRFCIETI